MSSVRSGAESADLILTGGPIHTVDPARSTARALAVRAGRIVAVGEEREIELLRGRGTRRIELRDRCVVPGFVDAHVHPIHAGLAMLRCNLHDTRGLDAYLRIVVDYAEQHPDEAWIRGSGWSMDDFPGGTPRRETLDAVVADRPVFLRNRDAHGAWVNGRALALVGVTRDTPDPPDGRIERDADGEPSGTLHEGAQALVERFIPDDMPGDLASAIRLAQAHLHALGITGWQDAWLTEEMQDAYERVAEAGELTGRVVGAMWWDRHRGLDQLQELVARRARGAIGRFRPTSVKLMLDGVIENFTAAMLEPYLDGAGRPSDGTGLDFILAEQLAEAVPALDREGFQVHFHAIGDRAVRHALDAVEVARRVNGWSDTRPHVAHIQVVHPEDLPRFTALGTAANAQPYWAVHDGQMDNLTIPFLGAERAGWQYPFGSLRRLGTVIAGGSDWSVSTANPLLEIEVMSNRVADDARDREPFLPAERLDPLAALAAFTAGSAWVNHADRETGSVEPRKAADLVVLDRDILASGTGPIGDARVLGTWVEGVAVWEDQALGA